MGVDSHSHKDDCPQTDRPCLWSCLLVAQLGHRVMAPGNPSHKRVLLGARPEPPGLAVVLPSVDAPPQPPPWWTLYLGLPSFLWPVGAGSQWGEWLRVSLLELRESRLNPSQATWSLCVLRLVQTGILGAAKPT